MSAYIYEGEDTTEVRKQALQFAKRLNCEASGTKSCGSCLSCRTFDSGNHPDTFFVKGTKQNGIGVDDVRDFIIMPMAVKPFKYKHKVFVIENPLTPQAQNALLKTIEEPAPYGVFLFLAENTHGFLPTVLSRCIVKKCQIDVLGLTAQAQQFQAFAEEIAKSVQGADIPQAFALYRKIEPIYKENKEALQEFLNALYIHYGKKINNAATTGKHPPKNWFNATTEITKTKQILKQNGNTQLAIELLLLNLR